METPARPIRSLKSEQAAATIAVLRCAMQLTRAGRRDSFGPMLSRFTAAARAVGAVVQFMPRASSRSRPSSVSNSHQLKVCCTVEKPSRAASARAIQMTMTARYTS